MLDLGVTGPMLRAAGLKMDARKDAPYSSYDKFDFEVPVRTENDVYARYQVRIEEMRQSARIVRQAMDGMPPGPWKADSPHVVLPDRDKMKTQMEALIYHFKIVTDGLLRGRRRHGAAVPRSYAHAQFRQPAVYLAHGGRHADRRRDRRHRQHGFCARRYGSMNRP
jgi:NADH:ubiquinone oxidoreductase subunit D